MIIGAQSDQANPLLLYVDEGKESKTAETLLRSRNIPIHVIEGCLNEGWKYPLLQFHPWEFEGLTEIRGFLALPMVQQMSQTESVHDHSRIIHGRSRQTDRYPDGCMVMPNPKLQ